MFPGGLLANRKLTVAGIRTAAKFVSKRLTP